MNHAGTESHHSFDCPECQQPFAARLNHVVLPGRPEWSSLQQGNLNRVACPRCGSGGIVGAPFIALHPDLQQATCFIPGFSGMAEAMQQGAVHQMIQLLEQALAGQSITIEGIRVNESYEDMVRIVRGEEGHPSPDNSQQEQIQQLLAVVQQLLNTAGEQRGALIRQLGDAKPLIADFAGQVAEHMAQSGEGEAATIAALRQLQHDLATPDPAAVTAAPAVTRRFDPPIAAGQPLPAQFSAETAADAKPFFRSGAEGRTIPSAPAVERPLNRPAVKLPHLVRLAIDHAEGAASAIVRLTDSATSTVVEAPFNLPPLATLNRIRELMGKARLSRQNP
ncbi:MAG TPA: hypothetical protein VD886_10240, partial [Herpetosiphonaceae bacterium]|nr:hypothetical protein [Herpetosiphonaceae bacterium]